MPATELAHPEEPRPLSIEEYKRIQQFPDHWEIQGSILDQYKQIGNAVPVGLGEVIGNTILDHHLNRAKNRINDFKYSRYRNTSEVEFVNNILNSIRIENNVKNSYQLELELN
jgi:DNA (cytosine-5)-methyltransferase 1